MPWRRCLVLQCERAQDRDRAVVVRIHPGLAQSRECGNVLDPRLSETVLGELGLARVEDQARACFRFEADMLAA